MYRYFVVVGCIAIIVQSMDGWAQGECAGSGSFLPVVAITSAGMRKTKGYNRRELENAR